MYLKADNERDLDRIESALADAIESVGGTYDRDELVAAIEGSWVAFPDCEHEMVRYVTAGAIDGHRYGWDELGVWQDFGIPGRSAVYRQNRASTSRLDATNDSPARSSWSRLTASHSSMAPGDRAVSGTSRTASPTVSRTCDNTTSSRAG